MQTKRFIYDLDGKLSRLLVEPIGDIHIGDKNCNETKLDHRIEAIRTEKNRYWIGMGDYISNIAPYRQGMVDKRWNYGTVDRRIMTQREQIDYCIEKFKPIAHKCIGLLWGNHEWGSIEEDDFVANFCKPLGVSFLGAKCFIYIVLNHKGKKINNFTIWATHGRYAGGLIGGAMNKLRRFGKKYDAEIYLMGHTHFKNIDPGEQVILDPQTMRIGRRPKMHCLTGTFLEEDVTGIDNYGDRSPSEDEHKVGTITLELDPWNSKVHAHE